MGLFHQLHRAVIVLGWTAAAGAALMLWSQRERFTPLVDAWQAATRHEGHPQQVRNPWEGEAIRIVDPLTFTLRDDLGRVANVRLTGIDLALPPRTDPGRATDPRLTAQGLADLVLSNTVTVRVTHQHDVGALLALAEVDGTNVNVALVAAGLAVPEPSFMNGLPFRVRYDLLRARRLAAQTVRPQLLPSVPDPGGSSAPPAGRGAGRGG